MSRYRKLIERIVHGRSASAIRFNELCSLLRHLRFEERVRGSHHIFSRAGVAEILNLQPRADGSAKPYQVRQVRDVLVRYDLGHDTDV